MKNLESKKWVRVREEDLQQMEALRQAAREGRLFILPAEVMNTAKREESIQAILAYVARIDECASEDYRPFIHQIWEAILRSGTLGELFFLYRYSETSGNPNWYRVTAAVEVLREKRIYRAEYGLPDLHRRMEQLKPGDKPKSSYSSKDRYLLDKCQRIELLQIVQNIRNS